MSIPNNDPPASDKQIKTILSICKQRKINVPNKIFNNTMTKPEAWLWIHIQLEKKVCK